MFYIYIYIYARHIPIWVFVAFGERAGIYMGTINREYK